MRITRTTHSRADGFSLVEVLVASAILVTVLTATLGVFSSSVTGSRTAADYGRAISIAVAQMAGVSHDADLEPSVKSGKTRDGFYWQTTVDVQAITRDEITVLRMIVPYVVTVRVGWQEREQQRSVEIHSLRLGKRL